MIDAKDAAKLKGIVKEMCGGLGDPEDFMWLDVDYEPIDDCDSLWSCNGVFDIKYGCSKAVLFTNASEDYVFKVPFFGIEYENGEKLRYSNAQSYSQWDYCEVEQDIYEEACAAGLGDMFCGTRYVCSIHGLPVYVSEKSGDALDEEASSRDVSPAGREYIRTKKRTDKCRENMLFQGGLEDETVGMFYDSWGKDKTDKLLKFIEDNDVADCHGGNVAFKDGKIRLIDYSGFDA